MNSPTSHPRRDPLSAADERDQVIEQKRFSSRTRFELRRDDFSYTLHADGNTRSYRMEYADLSRDRESLVERSSWWRNVGVIWMALGAIIAVAAYLENQTLRLPIWLWLGAACYAVYQFKVIRYRIIPAERCNVLIIEDARAGQIVDALEQRRAAQLRSRYDYLSAGEHPEQQRHRIRWLQAQGALDDNEVSARMLQLQAMESAQSQARLQHDGEED